MFLSLVPLCYGRTWSCPYGPGLLVMSFNIPSYDIVIQCLTTYCTFLSSPHSCRRTFSSPSTRWCSLCSSTTTSRAWASTPSSSARATSPRSAPSCPGSRPSCRPRCRCRSMYRCKAIYLDNSFVNSSSFPSLDTTCMAFQPKPNCFDEIA